MSFDLNSAETGNTTDLLPDGTVARAIMKIRPGAAGDDGWLTMSSKGGLFLDVEWTLVSGPHAKRKIWDKMHMTEKGLPITTRNLRAIVESHYGISPTDMSDAAVAKRRIGFDGLQGMEACILIGIEKDRDGQWPDKNRPKAFLTPGEGKYIPREGGVPAAATTPRPQAPSTAGAAQKPAWAA